MSQHLELSTPVYRSKGFEKPLKIIFEVFFYYCLLCWMLAYNQFNNKELAAFVPLVVILSFCVIKTGILKRMNKAYLSGLAAVTYIVIFDKIDNTNIAKYIHVTLLDQISLPTVLLSTTILIYLLKVLFAKSYILYIDNLWQKMGFAFLFLLITTILLYCMLCRLYQINTQLDLQLLNKLIKYSMLVLLCQECTMGHALVKRMTWGLLISISSILVLNITF